MSKDQMTPEPETEKRPRSEYANIVFLFKRPHSTEIVGKPVRVNNRDEHRKLLQRAAAEQLYLWTADVRHDENGKHYLSHLHCIDWESVPDVAYKAGAAPRPRKVDDDWRDAGDEAQPAETETAALECPHCHKHCTSTSGLTLHLKHCAAATAGDATPAEHQCPICFKPCTSSSGLTLHRKAAGH